MFLRQKRENLATRKFSILQYVMKDKCEETTYWYVEKDKCVENEETTTWYVKEDKS